jgi:photosystem II stability/assembly factor-like uncharacterized protein
MRALVLFAALTAAAPFGLEPSAQAQWTIQTPTTADLRGIDNVGTGIAWASGTNGTVLRSEDAGYLWQACTIPPGAEHLDFRGIQAFDANTAIVMSSGPGDQSRLYKTTDGCQTWTLLFTNPDKEGFWDTVKFRDQTHGYLLGDPVGGRFQILETSNGGTYWPKYWGGIEASPEEGAFAASNSSLALGNREGSPRIELIFGTGSPHHARALWMEMTGGGDVYSANWNGAHVPLATGTKSAGIFSLALRDGAHIVAVGGDYLKPNDSTRTAAFTTDGGKTWTAATTPPHGFRSAVAYDAPAKTWITVGPNGTDISTDDGRNWRPLHPIANEDPDADQHWNALSLPYAVGPHGRVGILNPSALQPTKP